MIWKQTEPPRPLVYPPPCLGENAMQTMKVAFPVGTTQAQAEEKLTAVGCYKLHHFYPDHQVGANTTATAVIEVESSLAPEFVAMTGVRVDPILAMAPTTKVCQTNCGCR